MHYDRSKRRTHLLKRLIIKFFVFLLIFGILPLSQPTLSPVAQAAEDNGCPAPVAMINGSFEDPAYAAGDPRFTDHRGWFDAPDQYVPGWQTTDSSGIIEIFTKELMDQIPDGSSDDLVWKLKHPVQDGLNMVELNSREPAQLYQDVETTPGQTIFWRLSHKGRRGDDTMSLNIGSNTISPANLPSVQIITTGNDAWKTYTGTYTVPEGQTVTRFGFEAVSSAGGFLGGGNLLDDIFLGTEPCVTSAKSVSPGGSIGAGSELTYTIHIKNEGGDVAADASITDAIPAGTVYVPGSMVMMSGSSRQNLTDEADTDPGQSNGSQVIIRLGDLPNTTQLPDGVIVQFKVKVLSDYAVKSISNKAQIDYDNLLSGEHEQVETNETKSSVIFPELDSSKTVSIEEKAAGNTDAAHPEVGDTLLYTIKARNTIADSTVKNLVVSDSVPSELEYVPGSLAVDGVSVTDVEGDDSGYYASSQVVGEFGDVSDMDWHTVQFKAVVQPGQAGKDIINIAIANGDNVATPDRPRAEVEVHPRNPQIESEKFVTNANVTKATYEVGDNINYTIRVRGVINDTYLENLTISDKLPAGLEYVPNSLKVDGAPVTDADDNDAGYSVTGEVYGSFGNVKGTDWHTLEFQAVIQAGQGGQTIQNTALVKGENIDQPGTPTEKVVVEPEPPVEPPVDPEPPVEPPVDPPVDPVDPPVTPPVDPGNGGGGEVPRSPVVESGKMANDLNGGSIEVGDTIEYTIRARNAVSGSQVTNLVISDELPQELEYVTGTLKVNGVSVTDSADGDRGEYVNGKVKGSFGTVTDNAWYTLVFQAKIIKGAHGDIIKNVGVVSGSNLNVPSRPSEEITINDPTSNDPAPVLESGKEVKDLNGGTIQVGDVIEYTIRTRNTTPNAVKNLKISDELPSELRYVQGSLKVDGQPVTDAQDTDKGSYVDGIVSGQFGNITNTAWHTIVFRAVVAAGQAGQTIRNVGEVSGDNLVMPDHPYEDIIIGGGSGSHPVIPGEPNDGSSTDKPSNPGGGDSDSKTPDSSHSGGSTGTGSSDDTDVAGESDGTGQSSQSGTSKDAMNAESGDRNGNKLPNTATNMYSYMLAGFILLLAGLFLVRRRKA